MKDRNKIVVIDLESTCWDDAEGNFNRSDGQVSEIIEFGIAVYDIKSSSIVESDSIIVKPQFSTISKFCTRLTGHTQEGIDKGITLKEALNKIHNKYKTKNRVWASWGDYDRVQIGRDCKLHGLRMESTFGRTHVNIKALHALLYKRGKECGVPEALKELGMKFEGRYHNGQDDAKNIAKVLKHIFDTFNIGITSAS